MTTTTFSKSDIVRKISALLTTAESFAKEGNDEAAASYVQKAHEMQQKHSIEQHLLTDKAARPQKIINKQIKLPGSYGKRKAVLAHVVAKCTDCTGYYGTQHSNTLGTVGLTTPKTKQYYYYMIFGFEDDVEWAETLITSLCYQSDDALKYALQDNLYEHHKTFGASFHAGFAKAISTRLHQAKKNAERQAQNNTDLDTANIRTSGSVGLVVIAKRKQVHAEMTARVGKLGRGSATRTNSYSGYNAGKDAGSRATIARGSVSSNSKGSLNQ